MGLKITWYKLKFVSALILEHFSRYFLWFFSPDEIKNLKAFIILEYSAQIRSLRVYNNYKLPPYKLLFFGSDSDLDDFVELSLKKQRSPFKF